MSSTDVVQSLIAAFNANDLERVMTHFSPDCVYHNIPMEPVTGVPAIRGVLESFLGMATRVDWIVHHVAETSAGSVLTERTDRFEIGGKWIELPVMGTFDVRDGVIVGWRDYFDMAQFQSQIG